MTTAPASLPFVHPADHIPGPPQGRWAYRDYATLPDDGNRYEVIDGVLYMAPAPTIPHQRNVGRIYRLLATAVEDAQIGEVFIAPVDVELAPNVVVQPDVLVVLSVNAGIVTPTRIVGAPDLVIEVASPGTAGFDRRQKQDAYARAGVTEYWIADASAHTIEVLTLDYGAYRSLGVFRGSVGLPSQVLPQLPIRVEQFFA